VCFGVISEVSVFNKIISQHQLHHSIKNIDHCTTSGIIRTIPYRNYFFINISVHVSWSVITIIIDLTKCYLKRLIKHWCLFISIVYYPVPYSGSSRLCYSIELQMNCQGSLDRSGISKYCFIPFCRVKSIEGKI